MKSNSLRKCKCNKGWKCFRNGMQISWNTFVIAWKGLLFIVVFVDIWKLLFIETIYTRRTLLHSVHKCWFGLFASCLKQFKKLFGYASGALSWQGKVNVSGSRHTSFPSLSHKGISQPFRTGRFAATRFPAKRKTILVMCSTSNHVFLLFTSKNSFVMKKDSLNYRFIRGALKYLSLARTQSVIDSPAGVTKCLMLLQISPFSGSSSTQSPGGAEICSSWFPAVFAMLPSSHTPSTLWWCTVFSSHAALFISPISVTPLENDLCIKKKKTMNLTTNLKMRFAFCDLVNCFL